MSISNAQQNRQKKNGLFNQGLLQVINYEDMSASKQKSLRKGNLLENQLLVNIPNQCKNLDIEIQQGSNQKQSQNPQNFWTNQEIQILSQLYEQHGSSWSIISSNLKNKTNRSIKNRFNNGLRRAANILSSHECKLRKKSKKKITRTMLVTMVNFSNQLKQAIHKVGLSKNDESMIFKFRTKIIGLSLKNQNYSEEELTELISLIKTINLNIKCFGVYKAKSPVEWKFKQTSIENVRRFDNIYKEKKQKTKIQLAQSTQYDKKQNKLFQENQQIAVPVLKMSSISSELVEKPQHQQEPGTGIKNEEKEVEQNK